VRVRLTRIDNANLHLFEFDYDLTFMVFFIDAKEQVYARYGGRDAKDPDNRQSLEGLRYTMQSVAAMHAGEEKQFAPRVEGTPLYIRDLPGGGGGKCMHCHQVKERLNRKLVAEGAWSRDMVYRYPLPDNLGFRLEVNRGNVVEQVAPGSAAEKAGLKKGDVVKQLGKVPIHSIGDASYALDKAPADGTLSAAWLRDEEPGTGTLTLASGWRRTDISWRPSVTHLVPAMPLYGDDLTAAERKQLGLTEKQLAFRQHDKPPKRAKDAGFQPGDIILGIEDRRLDLTVTAFHHYIRREYLVGDTIQLDVLRDGNKLKLPLVLTAR
jgi:predicted metalloprotease with PDZ domain